MLTMADVRGPKGFYQPIQFEDGTITLILSEIFVAMYEGTHDGGRFCYDINPDYQRDHVWTLEQQEAFVGHMLEGGAAPLVIVNRRAVGGRSSTDYKLVDEVVDGKQRLTALYLWRKGQIDGVLTDGRRINYNDLDTDARRVLCGMTGIHLTIGIGVWKRQEVLQLAVPAPQSRRHGAHPGRDRQRPPAARSRGEVAWPTKQSSCPNSRSRGAHSGSSSCGATACW